MQTSPENFCAAEHVTKLWFMCIRNGYILLPSLHLSVQAFYQTFPFSHKLLITENQTTIEWCTNCYKTYKKIKTWNVSEHALVQVIQVMSLVWPAL